ncbi:MAG: Holliday junction branch migration protein RuvA [Rickettsiaceae bacterium]|nr:Holliday junction branch migration protein RuvA [Rickettsiaceae bacterium]
MIGKLKGQIDSVYDDHFIIDVNGVGYLVYCSIKTLSKLVPGEHSELLIETHVREDHIHLYGFYNVEEKSTFTILQSVKGVGTRMALAILSSLTPEEIAFALSSEDKSAFNAVSGVGKKLAERIITELKDKFTSAGGLAISGLKPNSMVTPKTSAAGDAVSALVSLGINKFDAQNRVNIILSSEPEASINDLIRLALKNGASE